VTRGRQEGGGKGRGRAEAGRVAGKERAEGGSWCLCVCLHMEPMVQIPPDPCAHARSGLHPCLPHSVVLLVYIPFHLLTLLCCPRSPSPAVPRQHHPPVGEIQRLRRILADIHAGDMKACETCQQPRGN
jgi:hypothetical protein